MMRSCTTSRFITPPEVCLMKPFVRCGEIFVRENNEQCGGKKPVFSGTAPAILDLVGDFFSPFRASEIPSGTNEKTRKKNHAN